MKLAKVLTADHHTAVAVIEDDQARILPGMSSPADMQLTALLEANDPLATVQKLLPKSKTVRVDQVRLLAPIDQQEVWAAGVTYKRSQVARMEESESAASHYDKVYVAPRPEIFFKATPSRVVAPGQPVRVRADSNWSVPEPELALVINSRLDIVGYTIGNDMSARDIEGENPLYLPQAKVYRQCCALGPWISVMNAPLPVADTVISMQITRGADTLFQANTTLAQMHRSLPELVSWLGREDEFPEGAILLTGTGLVPDNFTLENGDEIEISISGIGTLRNPVVKDAAVLRPEVSRD